MATFTDVQIRDIMVQEAEKLDMQIKVDLEIPMDLWFNYGLYVMGFANAMDLSIHLFIEPLMRLIENTNRMVAKMGWLKRFSVWEKDPEKLLRKQIRKFLIHEGRHIEQYKYLNQRGIDLVDYMTKENKKPYFHRRHELDAYLVQYTGIRLPLKWVFGL